MEFKRYSAFISSNYTSLINERNELIDCLLDAQIIPICMEHFTVSSGRKDEGFEKFKSFKTLFDQSDIFIMLLGDVYGSCDSDGVSWTENEYDYAKATGKPCFVIKTEAYQALFKRYASGEKLSESETKQIRFAEEKIELAQSLTPERTIRKIVQQISSLDKHNAVGWIRRSELYDREWEAQHRYLDLRGKWYHVHLKENDPSYLRAGEVLITQNFTPELYRTLSCTANNYSVSGIDSEKQELLLNRLKRTSWSGDYLIKDDRKIMGVYRAERYFKGEYGEWTVEEGVYKGIHVLDIVDEDHDEDATDETVMLEGSFNDAYPAPKSGLLYLFRNKELRYQFLMENFQETFRSKI